MGGRAVDCDGLAYESARQAQRSRARTSGEQHRQVRSANKTVGLKDRRKNSFGWVAERSIATVLKTVVGATPPGVRIPPHPPENKTRPTGRDFLLYLIKLANVMKCGLNTHRSI